MPVVPHAKKYPPDERRVKGDIYGENVLLHLILSDIRYNIPEFRLYKYYPLILFPQK